MGTLKSAAPLSRATDVADDLYERARQALDRGDAEAARALIDDAFAQKPEDADVRELYASLHLARAIRTAAAAREARRQDIVRRDIPYDQEFQDSPEVAKAFEDALAAVDEVLEAAPDHEKARMIKASILFRRDRESGRGQALEILQSIAAAHPTNKQVASTIKKIERPCPRCSDTGFCPSCRGRGSKRLLKMERRCEACHGQGICLFCGVL